MNLGIRLYRKIYFYLKKKNEEWEDMELRSSLAKIGTGCVIKYPNFIRQPEQIYIGDNVLINSSCTMQCINYPNKGRYPKIIIGNNTGFNRSSVIIAANDIVIEEDVSVARNVYISNSNHTVEVTTEISYGDQPVEGGRVLIRKGAWIGNGAQIIAGNKGLTIGEKSIVGAGSIVTKDVPDHSIVVGNPAKVIKKYDFELKEWKRV